MRKPIVFWLWLVYSGMTMMTWKQFLIVHAQGRVAQTEQPTVMNGQTTDSNYNYQYDDTDFESVTDEPPFNPPSTTTFKAGRNFGGRIRGINNNSPYNAINNNKDNNSPTSGGISNRQSVDDSRGSTSPQFLSPRPTSSSVISYNPTNYNRVVKRRKNQPENTTTLAPTTTNYNSYNHNYSALNLNRTRGQQQQELVTALSQPTTSQNSSSLNKVMIRKRPRPITVNDFLTTTVETTVSKHVENNTDVQSDNNNNSFNSSSSPPLPLPSPSPSSFFNVQQNQNNVSLRSRRVKVTVTTTPTLQPQMNSVLIAEPVSHVPVVSLPKFEYNPSVSIKDGVYRYRYSEPIYSSKRVYSENFGVSRDTYGYDEEDEHDETTTFAPPPEPEGTTIPYQINIDGSEEEFTSSLPPVYRQYFDSTGEGDQKLQKRPEQQQEEENQQQPPPVDHHHIRNVLNAENKQGSITVTITHTVTASTPSPPIQPNKTVGLQGAENNQITGTKLNVDSSDRRPTSSVKDENSHPNTIPVVADQFNSSSNYNNRSGNYHQTQLDEDDQHEQILRPTPALPSYPIQPSTAAIQVNPIVKNSTSSSSGSLLLNAADSISPHKSNNVTLNDSSVTTNNNSIVKMVATPSSPSVDQVQDGGHGHQVIDNASSPNVTQTNNHNTSDDNYSEANANAPTPTVSSKVVSSVFYTKDENPYYTTSSYSYAVTTEYSYYVPHHQDHDHKHDNKDQDNSQKQQELRPTTTAYWDSLGQKSIDILKSKYITNATAVDNDQDLGYSTPEVDTELPPIHDHPFGYHTTPMPPISDQDHDHSNVHDNEIDDGSDSSDDSSDDDRVVSTNPNNKGGKGDKRKLGPGFFYNENDPQLPSVPVFIQVLLDMPATVFCSSVPRFKEMVVKVYAVQLEVTKEQVVVFNEPNCSNLTLRRNHTNDNSTRGSIRYATTTASVIRTVSSTSRTVIQRRNITHTGITPAATATSTKPPRVRRNDHHNSYHYHSHQETNDINGTNYSSSSTPSEATTLYPVFFYLTDKNGTYNQNLTESFIEFWQSTKVTSDTMFFDKVRKVEMVTPTQGITGQATNNENSGIIAAITIASIAAVCLFLLGVLLLVMRHRQAASKFAKRCTPVSLDDYSLDNISVYNSFRRKQRNRVSKRSYTNAAFDDPNAPSRPCNAAGLTAIVKETQKLEEEFLDLPNVNPTMDDIPVGAETKNRYANVIPVPDTRVLLTFQEDVPNSDYINANYVRGPLGTSKGYIITQGPLDTTKNDFWRLVWEQQIRVIMMLTDFSEAGIPKCAEYYPRSETVDSSQLHGDYQITLEKRDIAENCITSFLVIKDMERNLRRDVIHLWYHSWPEKGIPAHPKLTLDFLVKSRKFTKEPTPILVHCSPGTGRSGTLVACDICIREFESQQTVNIPRTVMKIRQDRAGAVQTKEQYLHIYDVVHFYSSRLGSQLDSI